MLIDLFFMIVHVERVRVQMVEVVAVDGVFDQNFPVCLDIFRVEHVLILNQFVNLMRPNMIRDIT